MIVGAYSIDLYCTRAADGHHVVGSYVGNNERDCIQQARKKGWKIGKRGSDTPENGGRSTLCPACACADHWNKK